MTFFVRYKGRDTFFFCNIFLDFFLIFFWGEDINIFRDAMFSIHLDNLKKEIKEFKQKENNEIKLHLNKISNNKKKGKIL